jgi:hypothetical protein
MLQPRSYPELVAKALVLENEPFETMVDDDAPWLEGLVLVAVVSLAGGVAVAMGNWLAALALPDPHAMWTLLLQGWRQLAANTGLAANESWPISGPGWPGVLGMQGGGVLCFRSSAFLPWRCAGGFFMASLPMQSAEALADVAR